MSVAATPAPAIIRWKDSGPNRPLPFAKLLPQLRAAAAAAPERADLKLHLARALFDAGQMAEVVDRLRPALADDGADPQLLHCLGRAAMEIRDDRLAFEALRSAGAKGARGAFAGLAATLVRLGREDEALQAALAGVQLSPPDSECLRLVARILLDRGEAGRLWTICRDLRSRGATGAWFSAVAISAVATLGLDDELAALLNRGRWFCATRLAVSDEFNRRLAAELLANEALSRVPPTKATRGAGSRIDRLHHVGGRLAQDLLAKIRAAIEGYVAERQAFADDPMIANRPASAALDNWALVVHDDGHEGWHIHPRGWISGVYYVDVPKAEAGGEGHPGAIEFGPYPFGARSENLEPYRWNLLPTSGVLLLFPSYYAHRTWPTGVDKPRICVAFDVRAAEEAPHAYGGPP